MSDLFAPDFKTAFYWWDRTPLSDEGASALATYCDVGIIGTGYTVLHAAIQTARLGCPRPHSTQKLPAMDAAQENGGQVSTSIKPSLDTLVCRR